MNRSIHILKISYPETIDFMVYTWPKHVTYFVTYFAQKSMKQTGTAGNKWEQTGTDEKTQTVEISKKNPATVEVVGFSCW